MNVLRVTFATPGTAAILCHNACRRCDGAPHRQPQRSAPKLSTLVTNQQCTRSFVYFSAVRTHAARNVSAKALHVPSLQTAIQAATAEHPGLWVGTSINTAVFVLGLRVLLAGLTPAGVANSWLLGTLVYAAFGWTGYLLVCIYFIAGSAVTKVKLAQKQREGIAEARAGRRSVGSVWGSGAAGIVCAAAALLNGDPGLWQVGFVASFASKLSDTVSSEIGKAYGKTTYLITDLRRVPRGTEGAVSLEGTLAGLAAAVGFAALSYVLGQVDAAGAAIVVLAAFLANLFESFLGATTQGQNDWLSNDVVNVIQISLAAGLGIAFMFCFACA